MDQVNLITPSLVQTPQLGIVSGPEGDSFNYPVSGGPFTSPWTFYSPLGQQITFTGSVTFYENNVIPVSWDWDFGDGNTANGQSVRHRYTIVYPFPQVVLRVTDNRGFQWATRQTMYMQNVPTIRIEEAFPIMSLNIGDIYGTGNAQYVTPKYSPIRMPVGASDNRIPGL